MGEVRPGPGNALPTDYTYTGQQVVESVGLLYYGARWYGAYLNRWIQPDNIVPQPGNPQDLNRFSYVRNNPLRLIDPSGHLPLMPPPTQAGQLAFDNWAINVGLPWLRDVYDESHWGELLGLDFDTVALAYLRAERETYGMEPLERAEHLAEVIMAAVHAEDWIPGTRDLVQRELVPALLDEPELFVRGVDAATKAKFAQAFVAIVMVCAAGGGGYGTDFSESKGAFVDRLKKEYGTKRLNNPLSLDEMDRVIEQAKAWGCTIEYDEKGLKGLQVKGWIAGYPHFNIDGAHIPLGPEAAEYLLLCWATGETP